MEQIAGNYLWEQNKKLAEKERDVATFHSSLLEKKKKELSAAKGKSNKLKEQLESLKIELMKAQEDLGAGIHMKNMQHCRLTLFVSNLSC